MKAKILFTLFITAVLAGCGKDDLTSKPSLKLRSVSSDVVPVNGHLLFVFDVTDKEGDLTDTLFVKKVRINRRVTPTIRDSFFFKVPEAPNQTKGQIEIDLTYQNFLISGNSPNVENDTLLFKFALRDKAKNISDTITSDPIVIIR